MENHHGVYGGIYYPKGLKVQPEGCEWRVKLNLVLLKRFRPGKTPSSELRGAPARLKAEAGATGSRRRYARFIARNPDISAGEPPREGRTLNCPSPR